MNGNYKWGGYFLCCFFSVFLLISLVGVVGFFWPVGMSALALTWREVPCTILTSEVRSEGSGDGGVSNSVQITYEYEIDGQRRVGTRYEFMAGSSGDYEGKKAVVAWLKPGTAATCYVSRRNPGDAVFQRGFPGEVLFGVIPLYLAWIGAGGLLTILGIRKKTLSLG